MSSKSKKGGKNERAPMNRQSSYKGNRQVTNSKPQTNKFQEPAALDFYNINFADSIVRLVGCSVQVKTIDGHIYDGVLEVISPKYEACLRCAHLVTHGNYSKQEHPTKEDLQNIKFDLKNVVSIKCENVDWSFPERDAFHTDTMISGSNGPSSTERILERWQPDKDEAHIGGLDDTKISNGDDPYMDLKRENEKKFNFKSSYNEETMTQYMDDIETEDGELHALRSQEADKVVREIELEDSYKRHDRLDSGVSEEDKYSSVKRPGFNSSQSRNSGMQSRCRGGRLRGPNYQAGQDHFEDHNDSRFHRHSGSTTKKPQLDETAGSKVLYSDCVKAQAQSEIPQNMRNSVGQQQQQLQQQPQQQQHMSSYHQAVVQEPLNHPVEGKAAPAVQSAAHPKPMGHHSLQSSNYQNNIPPRMQQQMQSTANARMHSSAQKSNAPPQRDSNVALSPISDVTADSERDDGGNSGGQLSHLSDKRVSFNRASPKLMHNNEMAKSPAEGVRHSQDAPLIKYGKVHQPQEPTPNVSLEGLKQFKESFHIAYSKAKKPEDAQEHDAAKANGDAPEAASQPPHKSDPNIADSKSPEHIAKTRAVQKNDSKVNGKESFKTSKVDPSQAVHLHATEEDLKNSSMSYSKRVKNPVDSQLSSGGDGIVINEESVIIRHSPEPKSVDRKSSDKIQSKVPEEKKSNEQKDLAPASEQKQSSQAKMQLNPNAGEFVPRGSRQQSPASSTAAHYHSSSGVGASQLATPVSAFQSSVPVNQVSAYPPRFRSNTYQQNYSGSDAPPPLYQGYMPQQGIQSQQQSAQPVFQYILLPQPPSNHTFPSQSTFVRTMQHHQGVPTQMVTSIMPEGQSFYVSMPGSSPMLHQQQGSIHTHPALQTHPNAPSQQPVHLMMNPQAQQYSQIASPMQSNPQGTPGPHPRPPTPQHAIHQPPTPPLHQVAGQQPMFFQQGQVQNVPSQAFVATQRAQHMPPFQ